MPKINPEILTWARETAGLSLEDAASKLGLSNASRLEAMEAGERAPTRRQLTMMAEKYRRPLLTFYLSKRPREASKGEDFRTLPEGVSGRTEPLLDALIRDVQARQKLVRAALEEAEEDQPLPFVNSLQMENGVGPVAESIKGVLRVSTDEFRAQKSVTDAFSLLRSRAERAGIFVLLMGNLGTHHTDIDVRMFRGFALADKVAPFVVINEKDSRAAWSFTLLHELAHIWLGQTGISGYDGEADIEKFCDQVAAQFLLNGENLSQLMPSGSTDLTALKQSIDAFSRQRNVSRKMVAYNLMRTGLISRTYYRSLSEKFDEERAAQKAEQPKSEGGPNYYIVRRHRIGPGLISLVSRMLAGGELSTTKAGKVLGVKPTAVNRLIENDKAA